MTAADLHLELEKEQEAVVSILNHLEKFHTNATR